MAVISTNVNIAFGLVTCQVNVHTALDAKTPNVTVCCGPHDNPHDPIKLRHVQTCSTCGETPRDQVCKARAVGGGFVILTDEDLAAVGAPAAAFTKRMDLQPHPFHEVDLSTVPGEKAYYLVPSAGLEGVYNALAALVAGHPELAFVTRFTPRTSMAVFRLTTVTGIHGPVLLMQERIAADKMRVAPEIAPSVPEQHEQLMALAEMVLSTTGKHALVTAFDLAAYRDSSAETLNELVASRIPVQAGAPGATTVTAPTSTALSQLQTMLASMEAAKPKRQRRKPTTKVEPVAEPATEPKAQEEAA